MYALTEKAYKVLWRDKDGSLWSAVARKDGIRYTQGRNRLRGPIYPDFGEIFVFNTLWNAVAFRSKQGMDRPKMEIWGVRCAQLTPREYIAYPLYPEDWRAWWEEYKTDLFLAPAGTYSTAKLQLERQWYEKRNRCL